MKYSIDELLAFSSNLKDYLCRVNEFITLHENKTEGHLKNVNFTLDGIKYAIKCLSGSFSIDKTDEKFAINFFESLENIQKLALLQPTVTVFFYYERMTEINGVEELVEFGEEKTYKSFDTEMTNFNIQRDKGHALMRIILK